VEEEQALLAILTENEKKNLVCDKEKSQIFFPHFVSDMFFHVCVTYKTGSGLDSFTQYTFNSELQATPALLLIYTLLSSPLHTQ
jgi:hypothetical protein